VKETEFSLREPQQTCEFGKEDGIKGIRPIYRSNRLTETFPLIYGSTYLIQRLLHQNCSLLWFVRLFRVVPDCFDWELTDGNRVRGSLNSVYNHYGIRTETEPLTERLDCVDRAPIRWGWRRGLREQREAGGACGTLFFSHPPTPSRVFVFDIVHNIVARGARVEG